MKTHSLVVLVLVAFFSPAIQADTPQITQVVVESTGPCLRVSFVVDLRGGSSRVGFYYGFDAQPAGELATRRLPSPANPATRTLVACNLPPNQRVYVQPFATDSQDGDEGRLQCSGVCRNCDFGAGPTDAHCDAAGEAPYIETADFSSIEAPAMPQHSFDPTPEPTIDGQTFTVDCQGGLATNFMELVGQAANADPNQWHKVEVPSGCKVKGKFNFPKRNGASGQGGILITTRADPKLLPPAGVRIDPSYRSVLARFEPPSDYSWLGGTTPNRAHWFYTSSAASGYRFQNIELGLPDHTEMPVLRYDVAEVAVNGNDVNLSLAAPAGSVDFFQPVLLDMQGCNGLQGYVGVNRPTEQGGGFQARGYQVSGNCTGGTATMAISWPLTGCSAGSPVRCDTAQPHGIPNLEALAVESISTNNDGTTLIRLSAAMHNVEGNGTRYILGNDVVMLEGSGTPLDGRRLQVRGGDATQFRVAGTFGASCSGGCGAVREIHPIQVFGTGDPALDGSRHFRTVDDDTIELLGTSSASGASGGYLSYDPPYSWSPISWSAAKRIVFDRVLLDCGAFPYRTRICVSFVGAEAVAFINSYMRGANYWLPMDPVSKSPRSARDGGRSFNPQAFSISMGGASDVQILNTTIHDAHGIVLFNDTAFNPALNHQSRDFSIKRTTVHMPYRFLAGHPESDGRYYQNRHCYETKSMERLLIEGFRCSGNWADWTPSGPAILISPRGKANVDDPIHAWDITIRGSIFERVASGIQTATETRVGFNVQPILRVDISNNIFADIDHYTNRSSISGVNGLNPATGFGGYFLTLLNSVAHVQIKRNTMGFQRGRSTELVHFFGQPSSIVRFEDNILNFSQTDTSIFGFVGEQQNWTPGCGNLRGPALFNCAVNRAGKPDPLSAFDGNVVFGCLKNAGDGPRQAIQADMALPGRSLSKNAAASYFGDLHRSRPNDYLQSSSARSCKERLDEIFEPGTFVPTARYQGKGADPALVKRYLGEVGPVSVQTSSTETRLSYEAPDDVACYVDYSTQTTFVDPQQITRVSDGGGSIQREVTLSGLQPSSNYAYRILCAAQQPRGVFSTP